MRRRAICCRACRLARKRARDFGRARHFVNQLGKFGAVWAARLAIAEGRPVDEKLALHGGPIERARAEKLGLINPAPKPRTGPNVTRWLAGRS